MIYLYVKQHNDTGLMYFGKTENQIPESYDGSGKYWKRHLKKYSRNISTILFEEFDDIDDAKEFAEFFNETFDIVNSDGWANLIPETVDGSGQMKGYIHTSESKSKMSKANTGENNPNFGTKWSIERTQKLRECNLGSKNPNFGNPTNYHHTEETIAKISKTNTGKKRTEETRNKVRESVKEQYKNGKVSPLKGRDISGENNPFFGKKHNEDSRLKISLAKSGKAIKTRTVACPHCGKNGGASVMKRWHFNNCKYLINKH